MVAGSRFFKLRDGFLTSFLANGAPCMEGASSGHVHGVRKVAFNFHAFFFRFRINGWNRRQQSFCVRVLWFIVQWFAVGKFNYFSKIHNRHTVTEVSDYGHVMGNEQIGYLH